MSPITRALSVGFLAAAMACASNDDTGDLELEGTAAESRIVGGAAFSGLPGVGSILRNGTPYCTGTLIDSRHVVTAAHCFHGLSTPSSYRFVTGPNARAPLNRYNVSAIRVHPAFNYSTVTDDIAVITLSTSASEAPLAVLDNLDSAWVGAELFFVGYGVDNGQRQSGNGVKRSVIMPISEVGSTQFAYETAGKNTCSGDSGGPAFFVDQQGNYLLAGVTSYGDTYCTQYGVDTIVSAYLGWLGVTGTAPNAVTQPPADPCGGETFEGRCEGSVVHWCENDQVYQADCAPRGKTCGFSDIDGFTGCLTRSAPPADPCAGESYRGRCNGNTVVWCENNSVQRIDCGAHDGVCEYDTTRGINNCSY